jgi:nitrate reductase NapAB chaperone NapD
MGGRISTIRHRVFQMDAISVKMFSGDGGKAIAVIGVQGTGKFIKQAASLRMWVTR